MWRKLATKRSSMCLVPHDAKKIDSIEFPSAILYRNVTTSHKSADNDQNIADLFAEFFSNVYSNNNVKILNLPTDEKLDFSICDISLSEVFEKISHLPKKLSYGPDKLPEFLIRNLKYSITLPLCLLFNKSLAEGELPRVWKSSYIIPVFKSGGREYIENYRSISRQSAIPKILDSLVCDQLSWACRGILDMRQHGFIRGRSTTTNLVSYELALLEAFECGYQVDSIYTDFSKAFDRVNLELLLAKLKSLGFGEKSLKWFRSMLIDRVQFVKIGDCESQYVGVTSGVPQGGHCAPLLFNLFLLDLITCLSDCDYLLYADDLKIFRIIKSQEDSDILQKNLDSFVNWAKSNDLSLNINKCYSITFTRLRNIKNNSYTIEHHELQSVNSIKDLGVVFDSQLSFREHYNLVEGKASQMLGFIIRTCRDMSLPALRLLYCSLVRSHLEYASTVWSPFYNCHKVQLERIQNKFIKYCSFKLGMHNDLAGVAAVLNLQSLESRRDQRDLSFIYKLINGLMDCPSLINSINLKIPSRSLRKHELFHIPYSRTNYNMHSPISRTLTYLNSHPDIDPFVGSLSKFLNRL